MATIKGNDKYFERVKGKLDARSQRIQKEKLEKLVDDMKVITAKWDTTTITTGARSSGKTFMPARAWMSHEMWDSSKYAFDLEEENKAKEQEHKEAQAVEKWEKEEWENA